LLAVRNDPHLRIDRFAREFGDICLLRFGSVPTVVISHPDLLKEAFDKTELSDRWMSQIMGILTHHGKDLAMAPYGEHWRQMQRFANRELLSRRNLQQIREQHMEEIVSLLVAEVGERSDSGQPVDPTVMLSRSNSTIMFRAIFGRKDGASDFQDKQAELLAAVYWTFQNATATNLADYIPWLGILPNGTISEARKRSRIIDDIIVHLINGVRARPDLDLKNPTCLVELMLARQAAGELTEESMTLLITNLMMAGIDTSAQTVTWLLLILANRPEIQRNIHEEMDRAIGPDSVPTVEDRERLPYLNAVILENMRYRTVGPLALPHKAAVTCQVGGYTIPAGAQVLGNLYSIHHDPRFWESPDRFVPERFLPREDGSPASVMTSGAFIPFGVGGRSCPGRNFGEIVVWLHASRLLHRFQFRSAGPGDGPISEQEVFGLTVGPKPFALYATGKVPGV
jgi:cytochrome P450 family 2 subfamily U polypeptide 1